MSIFEAFVQEFETISAEISANTIDIRDNGRASEDQGRAKIKKTESLLQQSNDVLQQMQIESRSAAAAQRKALGDKVLELKKQWTNLKTDFERAKEACQRSALIGDKSVEQRQKMLNTNEK